jgi:hypothetical protein
MHTGLAQRIPESQLITGMYRLAAYRARNLIERFSIKSSSAAVHQLPGLHAARIDKALGAR